METEYLEIKHDCMWSGNCDRKCSDNYKMESLISKSPFTNDNLSDLYYNLYGGQMFNSTGQDSIDLLDSLDSNDLNVNDLLVNNNSNGYSTTAGATGTMNPLNGTQQPPTVYYQSQSNYSSNQTGNPNTQLQIASNPMTNQLQPQQPQTNSIKLAASTNPSFNNQTTSNANSNYHPPSNQSTNLLNSSLNNEKSACYLNDLLLSSTSANIMITQQPVDSQLNSNHQIANYTHDNSNLDNLSNLDLINNSNRCTDLVVSCSNDDTQCNTQTINPNHFASNYQQILNQNHSSMMSSYSFDNQLMESTFGSDSAGSSNNSECSSSILLERTDYDTDDIEDDLDLLEDIIEEECDDIFTHQNNNHLTGTYNQRSNYHSIANSSESSSDDMSVASPISDSLINDHSYGASSIASIDKAYEKLTTTPYIVNGRTHSSIINNSNMTITSNHRNNSNLLHHVNPNSSNRITKRRSLASINQNQTANTTTSSRRSLQRHSGTSLLMKDKQSKMKKVMDTDRRKEHNESERMRRDVLKNAFLTLRNRCPKLSNSAKKSSRIQILNEATVYIKQINEKFGSLKEVKDQEKQRNEELKARLLSLGGC